MHSCTCNTRSTHFLYSLHIYLAFLARPFSGLVDEAAYHPIKFTPAFWCGWDLPISVFFCFSSYIVQLVGLSEKYWGLHSVIEGSTSTVWFRRFGRRIRSCCRTWLNFPRDLALRFCPNYLRIIVSCHQVSHNLQPLCPYGGLMGFYPLLLPMRKGSKVLGGTASKFWAMSR